MRGLPRSLSARLFLIVLGGVVLAIAISNSLHHRDRARLIEEYRERTALEHLTDAIALLAALAPDARIAAASALPQGGWLVDFAVRARRAEGEATPGFRDTLRRRLGDVARVEGAWRQRPPECSVEMPDCSATYWTHVMFPEGQAAWLGYTAKIREPLHRREWLGVRSRDAVFIGIMAVVAWLVVRLALRPLQRMTQAAEDFGRDIAHPPMDESGPIEVRRAAHVFNAMQERIRDYMAERTQILAAVTHDLKTPLTRMRLRLENCADEALKDKLQGDIGTMLSLVEEGLELARSLDTGEAARPVDLGTLLQSLCDDAADAGQDVTYDTAADASIVVIGRPNALRRVFANLIDNAVKYGHYCRVSLERSGDSARVKIRDGGPGIPAERLQDVLKPFVRLEGSRSRGTGGTGLGLAIALNLLRTHQGALSLKNGPEGGLEVTVELRVVPVPKRL